MSDESTLLTSATTAVSQKDAQALATLVKSACALPGSKVRTAKIGTTTLPRSIHKKY